ncbi:60S ribosomal protein L19 [Cordyceps fumosorosea ARSEF 2679]|uniref:60S ribosomal protein L19 n=1 Tax=Cordyceps fumosorosea (strain ARSEF 2679) TaxID=1081104 RepID=A0A168B3J2_CORFA|nr:60S ribosomal protein L19 [Cordyceps fumosorosea ARSEF 2679]OAA69573.1 60S ribosomal protein L19 [Cordyceps fumosorosea ARSEF 2679]
MRNGTFVIPSTGERSRKQFTLRASATANSRASIINRYTEAETICERCAAMAHDGKSRALALWHWLCSDQGHQVLKCTFAYVLGSLATFSPLLSDFLGDRDGKHIVATLTVFFHPARTTGSMIEAILVAIVAVICADLVCVLSMTVAVLSRRQLDSVAPAHAIILLMAVGGGLGFIAWVKQRLNQPLVNVAATLASIAIISMVTKDDSIQYGYFSDDRIVQVLKMLLIGITFSAAVNVLVWPVAARHILRKSITTASSTLSDRLSFVTRGFLIGSEEEVNSPEYHRVSKSYTAAYGLMTLTLREAKLEYYVLGQERIYQYDKRLVKSLDSVSQAIGGLRSALNTQFTLLREGVAAAENQETTADGALLSPKMSGRASSLMDVVQRLSVIEEDDEPRSNPDLRSDPSQDLTPIFRVPSDIFALFMALLGPSMKSLAYTLSEILREPPFGKDLTNEVAESEQLRESLRDALGLYNSARSRALQEVYRSMELGRTRSEAIRADIEEVAAACGHFSFSLLAVAEAMDSYLDVLEELKHSTETLDRSWNWMKFWRFRWKAQDATGEDAEREPLLARTQSGIRRSALPKGIPTSMKKQRDSYHWDASSQSSSWTRSFSQLILNVLRFLSREDVVFGIKIAIGAVLWAMFAFIPATRPVYQTWRGEWGLLSYMVVVGMTNGASNTTGLSRLIGTLIGAVCACAAWIISFGNAYALAIFGFFMALGNFYMILIVKNGPLGRISLLAYNVIVLYAYSISQQDELDDDEGGRNPLIFDITYHRVIAVTLGIVWGMLFCRMLWPISGRAKFREGLAVLYLQLGLIWKRGPLTILAESDSKRDYMDAREQAALQRYAFKLEALRASAKSEFELRGPFPNKAYSRVLHATKHILDGFYAMRLISEHRGLLSAGERALLDFTAAERLLLCQRISHVFQVLASCIMLEYPLTDVIPTIESNKDRLLGKIHQFRVDHLQAQLSSGDGKAPAGVVPKEAATTAGVVPEETATAARRGSASGATPEQLSVEVEERDYALVYAYILVTAQVAADLQKVREEIEGLFGVLHQNDMLLE